MLGELTDADHTAIAKVHEENWLSVYSLTEAAYLAGRRAADAALREEIAQLKWQLRIARSDADEESRSSATEARWKERQGDDYGSY